MGVPALETIRASEFKAKCLALMDEVAATGKTLLITKNGKPVAELRPHRPPRVDSPFGRDKSVIKIQGDIVSPVAPEAWDALR